MKPNKKTMQYRKLNKNSSLIKDEREGKEYSIMVNATNGCTLLLEEEPSVLLILTQEGFSGLDELSQYIRDKKYELSLLVYLPEHLLESAKETILTTDTTFETRTIESNSVTPIYGFEIRMFDDNTFSVSRDNITYLISLEDEIQTRTQYSSLQLSSYDTKDIYTAWKNLVNTTSEELESFYSSKDGKSMSSKELGLSNDFIKRSRESANALLEMIPTSDTYQDAVDNWTTNNWQWASRHINFITNTLTNINEEDSNDYHLSTLSLRTWGHDTSKDNKNNDVLGHPGYEVESVTLKKKNKAIELSSASEVVKWLEKE